MREYQVVVSLCQGENAMRRQCTRPPQRFPEPKPIVLPPKGYQASKAEQEEEFGMLGMSISQVRATFFRTIHFQRRK